MGVEVGSTPIVADAGVAMRSPCIAGVNTPMSDEREWVPVEVIWDGGGDVEDERDELRWLFDELEEADGYWPGTLQGPEGNPYLTKRKRKKLRGEGH